MEAIQQSQYGTEIPQSSGQPDSEPVRGPEKKFRAGTVSANVWKNDRQRVNGEVFSYPKISLERSYKDPTGNWKRTSSLRLQDLPKAALVLQEAYRYLVLAGLQDEVAAD